MDTNCEHSPLFKKTKRCKGLGKQYHQLDPLASGSCLHVQIYMSQSYKEILFLVNR